MHKINLIKLTMLRHKCREAMMASALAQRMSGIRIFFNPWRLLARRPLII
jgi:hypothetical protein